MVLSRPVPSQEVPWEQRRFHIRLDDGPDFVVRSLLVLPQTLGSQLETTYVPTSIPILTSDASFDQVDQLFDHCDLVLLRFLDSARLKARGIDLVHEVEEELAIDGVDEVKEPLSVEDVLGLVLVLVEPRDVLHDLLVVLDHLEDVVD